MWTSWLNGTLANSKMNDGMPVKYVLQFKSVRFLANEICNLRISCAQAFVAELRRAFSVIKCLCVCVCMQCILPIYKFSTV